MTVPAKPPGETYQNLRDWKKDVPLVRTCQPLERKQALIVYQFHNILHLA